MSTCIKTAAMLVSSFVSINACALCTASDVAINLDKKILIQRDAPVGTVLATITTTNPIACTLGGSGAGDGSWLVQLSPANIDNGSSPLAGVRNTNIDGIGIRWENINSKTGTSSRVTNSPLNSIEWKRGIGLTGTTTWTDTFELVKTSATPKTGTLTPTTIAMQYSTPVTKVVYRSPLFRYIISTSNTATASCQVLDSNLNVDMGFAAATKFNGVGSTLNSVPFAISLNCDALTSVNIKLDSVSTLADAANGVLGLSSASTAKGVGIQITYNDVAVKLGSLINYGTTSAATGMVHIPFKAAYYKTLTDIEPGTVNATASFTLTYQ